MDIKSLPNNAINPLALGELVFTDFNDAPENPRPGLGYHQLYDPSKPVSLIARLPEVSRVGDTITLYWYPVAQQDPDTPINVQQYDLDQATIDKGWLSFSVSPSLIMAPQGKVYYTLLDHLAGTPEQSTERTVAVNRNPPGGLDPDTETAINERLAPCTVSPNLISNPDTSVTVTVPKWADQEVGDELTVMWNNVRVDHPKLTALGAQSVSIAKAVLEQGGSSDKLMVNYEIRDIVDNYSLVSPATFVRVEIDPLALPAPRVKEANQTTLVLDLEALGDSDATVQIPVFTGNGQSYEVTLTWIGKTPTAEIILTLPPQTVQEPDFEHAEFSIPNAELKKLAGGSAVLRYTLLQSGDAVEKQSKTTSITLTGLPVELDAPQVQEANGTLIIDLETLSGSSVTVEIPAYTGQSEGDKILLTWRGTAQNGNPVNYADEYTIKAGEELKATTFLVLRENLDPLGDGTLALSYQVVFAATGSTQNSVGIEYQVKAAQPAIYPAPTLKEAANGVLNPMNALAGATLTVAYDDMTPTDTIAPIWNGQNALVPWQLGNTFKSVDFIYPISAIAASLGQAFDVSYAVERQGSWTPSLVLGLTVSPLPDSELAKSRPVVTEAQDGVLDLNTFQNNAHTMVAKWPLAAVGQPVWLTVTGPNGVPTIKLLEAFAITQLDVDNGISREIPRTELDKFNDADVMTVVFKVGFAGSTDEASATGFPQLQLRVDVKPPDVTDDFIEHSADLINAGELIKTRYMTIRFVSGTGKVGFQPNALVPPEATNNFAVPFLQVARNSTGAQKIEIEMDVPYKGVTFDVHGVNGGIDIRYLDPSRTELKSQKLDAIPNQTVSYTSTGNLIRYIEINSDKDWTIWDNFILQAWSV